MKVEYLCYIKGLCLLLKTCWRKTKLSFQRFPDKTDARVLLPLHFTDLSSLCSLSSVMPKVYTPLTPLEHKNPHLQPLKGLCCPAVLKGEVAQQLPELRNTSPSLLIHQLHPVDELCLDNVTMTCGPFRRRAASRRRTLQWRLMTNCSSSTCRKRDTAERPPYAPVMTQQIYCLEIIAKLILFPGNSVVKQSVWIGRLLLWQRQVLFQGTGPWIQGTASEAMHVHVFILQLKKPRHPGLKGGPIILL